MHFSKEGTGKQGRGRVYSSVTQCPTASCFLSLLLQAQAHLPEAWISPPGPQALPGRAVSGSCLNSRGDAAAPKRLTPTRREGKPAGERVLRAGAGPETRVHGSLRVGGSSEHPQAAQLCRPRLTPGGEESPETPREPPKLGHREGSHAWERAGVSGEPGAPRQCGFPAPRRGAWGWQTPGFRAAGRRNREDAWLRYAWMCGPGVSPPSAARQGNLEQRRCLKQKPDCRTPGAARSQSPRRTLMYRCPISASNWRPPGRATRERGRRALSPQALPAPQGNK